MSTVVVVTVQHRIVNQLHFLLCIVALSQRLLSQLTLTNRRRIRTLNVVHKTTHQLLPETVQRTSSDLLHLLHLLLIHSVQRIVYRFIDLLTLNFYSLLLLITTRMDRISLHFNILLNLIFFIFRFSLIIHPQFILKKLSVSQSRKLLAQLHILILTKLLTRLIKTHILSISKTTPEVLRL